MAWERTGPAVELHGPVTDLDLFERAVLTLSWPRSVPDYFSDEAVSEQLREWTIENRDNMPWHGFADNADDESNWEK